VSPATLSGGAEAMTIHYTPGQLRDVLGLPKETLRYWKKELGSLIPSKGQRASFGPADLLAVSVIKEVTDLGVPIGRIAGVAPEIFRACHDTSWPQLERTLVILDLRAGCVSFEMDPSPSFARSTLQIPLQPLMETLRGLLLSGTDHQRALAFPPATVSRRA
jgi:hypothetical protein